MIPTAPGTAPLAPCASQGQPPPSGSSIAHQLGQVLPPGSPATRGSGKAPPPGSPIAHHSGHPPPRGAPLARPSGWPPSHLSRAPDSIPRAGLYPDPARSHLSRTPTSIPRASLYPTGRPSRACLSQTRAQPPTPAQHARGARLTRPKPTPWHRGLSPVLSLQTHRSSPPVKLDPPSSRPAATRTKNRHCAPDQPRRKLFRIGKRIAFSR